MIKYDKSKNNKEENKPIKLTKEEEINEKSFTITI